MRIVVCIAGLCEYLASGSARRDTKPRLPLCAVRTGRALLARITFIPLRALRSGIAFRTGCSIHTGGALPALGPRIASWTSWPLRAGIAFRTWRPLRPLRPRHRDIFPSPGARNLHAGQRLVPALQ